MRARGSVLVVIGTLVFAQHAVADLWTTPTPVSEINTQYDEGAPFLSYDGHTLYFSRYQPNPQWLYSATRMSPDAPFGVAMPLAEINTSDGRANYSWVSPDNLRLYYYTYTNRHIIKMSTRISVDDAWSAGVSIAELNSLGGVANPSLTPDELTIVFTGTNVSGGLGGYDIWMGTRTDTASSFGNWTKRLRRLTATIQCVC